MGYCISMMEPCLSIKADKLEEAFLAVKAALDPTKGSGWSSISGVTTHHFSWVGDEEIANAKCVADFFTAFRFEAADTDSEDYVLGWFNGEKIGDEDQLFDAVAPFVADGSYIEWQGEDGERWRDVFRGGRHESVTARIVWDD